MKKLIVALACVALALGMVAAAFAEEGGLNGKTELSVSASWVEVDSDSFTQLTLGVGKFITPNVEPGLDVQYQKASGSDAAYVLLPNVSYNFISETTTNLVPFVGVGWAFARSSGEDDNALVLGAGLRFFLDGDYNSSSTTLFLKYQYTNDLFDNNINQISLGISKFF
ncbi:MAG: hypothetical protein Q7T82_16315 [Armatimonadota bacterium]|nr:hypothetical protein [Armatimonadota bacterium]